MRDEKEGRKKQARSNNKAKQHSTPKAVTFPEKNELPRVGPLYTLDRALYHSATKARVTTAIAHTQEPNECFLTGIHIVHVHVHVCCISDMCCLCSLLGGGLRDRMAGWDMLCMYMYIATYINCAHMHAHILYTCIRMYTYMTTYSNLHITCACLPSLYTSIVHMCMYIYM